MITIKNVPTDTEYYQDMRELRNKVLLRPLGIADHAWEMHDQIAWHFAALDEDKVVGCALLVPSKENKYVAQLIQMAVDPTIQGKGIGKSLVTEIIKFAQLHQLNEITCHARAYAAQFYEKLGFEKYGEPFEEVGIPHFMMTLKLR